ncbi:AlpA family phage regulatory protein [Ferrimonas balearica]|uniref:helix-turn-helix transcriptional regulator n=1 Tax=Ferrimonas balearica TaxID=44012 RepID=UPI001C9755C8|nr:AlpA family phage regulatory protein [Ferrimonas balearica]MBY6108277.1 AlpA family phage regulatory protein [Ferrimonas balearica]
MSCLASDNNTNNDRNDRFVLEPECRTLSGLSRQRRWKMESEGRFPHRIKLGERINAWRLSELHQWMDQVTKERGVKPE